MQFQQFQQNGHRRHLKPLVLAVRLALSASLMAALLPTAQAQQAVPGLSSGAVKAIDIPAGSLAEVLNRYAQQSGVALAVDASKLKGIQSAGLKGSYRVEEGFAQLLRNSGFEIRKTGAGYVLEAVPAASVTNTNSGNATSAGASSPVRVSSKAPSADASGQSLPTVDIHASSDSLLRLTERVSNGALGSRSVIDTPFSITVLKSEDIAERQVSKLGDVFALDASVSDNSGAYSSWASYITVRGLPLDWQNAYRIDGTPFMSYGITLPYEHFEQVELLKGASGFMHGFGAPGGLLNYVTKKPTETPVRSIDVGFKSNNIWSEHIDLGDRFGTDKMFGYRLNATHEQGKTYNDGQIRRDSVSLALDARLTRDLTWELNGFYQNRNSENQTPSITTGALAGAVLPKVPASDNQTLLGRGQHLNTNFKHYSTGLKYAIDTDWKLSLQYSRSDSRRSRNESTLSLVNARGDYNEIRSDSREAGTFDQWQAMLEGKFKTGSVEHQLVAGASWQKQVNDYSISSFYQPIGSGNLYRQNTNDYYSATTLTPYHNGDVIQQAFFLSDTLTFSPQWSLLAGVRTTNFEQNSYGITGNRTSQYKQEGVLTPTLALMYKPLAGTTIYASYVESLEPGGIPAINNSNFGSMLKPLSSKQYELGVKTAQDDWSASAALFRIERGAEYTNPVSKALVQDGQSSYQGLELGATRRLGRDWQVLGNLMLLDTEYSKGIANNGNRVAGAPKYVLTAQVSYDVANLPGLKISADSKYTGPTMLSAANNIELKGFALFNLGASYVTRIGKYDTTWRAAINNLTDKRYWEYQYENWIKPGDPRTFSLNVKLDF